MRCWAQHLINHVVVCRVVSSVMTRVPTLCGESSPDCIVFCESLCRVARSGSVCEATAT